MDELGELLVYDQPEVCPYLPDRKARLPLRQPLARLSPEALDRQLAAGDRRSGGFLYRTACPTCSACRPIRVPVEEFTPSRSQLRVQRKCERVVDIFLGAPAADESRARLYNKHRELRGLGHEPISVSGYREFLVNSCCDTLEIDYVIDDVLAAVAILDRGAKSLSAVYCCFDPEYSKFSLGVYSILTQIQLAQMWNMEFLYLGLYIAESPHMRYKHLYRPHELLMNGEWVRPKSSFP